MAQAPSVTNAQPATTTQATSLHIDAPNTTGHLVIIGGGLRPNNEKIYSRMIACAGGAADARFVVLPTASSSQRGANEFRNELQRYGVPQERCEVLDVTEQNAATATSDPALLDKLQAATAVFLAGGDQRRLVRALTNGDGSDTPLLHELRQVYLRGGLVAGSSAGASAQSEIMLAVSGLPDRLIDEGLDTLDFGCTDDSTRRGLLITRGLGLFKLGIIDQHFYQYRGRLGRLIRATVDQGIPFGFGIDENTAMVIAPDQAIEVVGEGFVTVIESKGAAAKDGPLGYRAEDVKFSVLSDGDRFEPRTQQFVIAAEKPPLVPAAVEYDGNFTVNDIGAGGAIPFALVDGLAENLRPTLDGVSFRHHGETLHGYRFHFRKTPTSATYSGVRDLVWRYSLLDLRVDIAPIATGFRPSQEQRPSDLGDDPEGNALAAIAFRGLLTPDADNRFRAADRVTRREFAAALARSVHLVAGEPNLPQPADIENTDADRDEIARVIVAGLMQLDDSHAFRPADAVANGEAAVGLAEVAKRSSREVDPLVTAQLAALATQERPVTRGDIGKLLHHILRLP